MPFDLLTLALAGGALAAVGALGWWAMAGPSPDKEGARRLQAVRDRHADTHRGKVEAQLRKALAARGPGSGVVGSKPRAEALLARIKRTGKPWTVNQYLYVSAGIAVAIAGALYLKTGAGLVAIVAGLAAGMGLPHFAVGTLIKRRLSAFTTKFPDAIELLVRGLRSGLPVSETLALVGSEVPGPVGEEFKLVSERMRIGKTMEDSLQDTADSIAMAEFNFFCISLAIQRETGGNLAETLSNLADVLRKRAQMKLKVKAMSSESKASAYIVGSLPFIVFAMVYYVSPAYLASFFTDPRLMIAGGGGLVWMGIGAFIMAKMVSFEI